MIQSSDCRFYETGYEYGYPEYSTTQKACSKTEMKRKEKKESPTNGLKEKRRQGQLSTKWLKQNYCASPDVCLPREIVYEQYLDFCRKERMLPACKATFGKLIRNTFPEVSSKRLGARGHSKYHYNGIGIKQSSHVRSAASCTRGLTRFSSVDNETERVNMKKFSLSSKVGTLLPNFPKAENLDIPVSSDKIKMATFILMYKIHCQCIVDVAISENFEEIQLFLLHFWQGFPEHLMSLRTLDVFLDVVAFCDCILYQTLLDVLIPSVNYEVPERLLRSIHSFAICWNLWVQCSLENMPEKLLEVKMTAAKKFCRTLKRCVAFMHLMQVNRSILASDAPQFLCDELEELLPEIESFNLHSVTGRNEELTSNENYDLTTEQTKELQNIFKNSNTISMLVTSLDNMIINMEGWKTSHTATRNCVFNWIFMLSKISYLLTENQSRYFTTFHLLSSLFQEYILLAVETQLDKEHEKNINDRLNRHLKNDRSTFTGTFKSTTSCFLVDRNTPERTGNAKEKLKNSKRAAETIEPPNTRTCINSTETYPRTCTYLLRTENESFFEEKPSCKYASSSHLRAATYETHVNSVFVRDKCSNAGFSQYTSGHFVHSPAYTEPQSVNSSLSGFSLPQLEFCQFDADPSSSSTQRAYTNHDISFWNRR